MQWSETSIILRNVCISARSIIIVNHWFRMNVRQVIPMLFLLHNERTDFMDDCGLLLRCESAINIEDVGVTAVAIIDIVLILGRYEISSSCLMVKRLCHKKLLKNKFIKNNLTHNSHHHNSSY